MLKFLKRKKIANLLKKHPDVLTLEVNYHDLTSSHYIVKVNNIPAPDFLGSQTCSAIAALAFSTKDEYKQFLVEAELKSDSFLDFILELEKILGSFGCPGTYMQDSFILETSNVNIS